MDIDKIMQLIDKVDASGISSLTVEEGCLKISIEKTKGQAVALEGSQRLTVPVGQRNASSECALQETSFAAAASQASEVSEHIPEVSQEDSGEENAVFITSPIVGVFYNAPGPEEEPFIKAGDRVKKGQIVGIVEAMKLMNEIESDVDGVIDEILIENAQSVEYGQSLFKLK